MTTIEQTPESKSEIEPRRNRLPWFIALFVTVAIVVGGVAVAARAHGNSNTSVATAAPSAAWMQDACQQWMGTYTGVEPPASWCASMWSWMQSGRAGMMGTMWWGNADTFRAACTSRAGTTADE